MAISGISSARLRFWIDKGSIFVTGREGVIEIIEESAAGHDELPCFHPVMGIVGSLEAGFIIADHFIQSIVQGDGVRRGGVMKIKDRNSGMSVFNSCFLVGDVLRQEVFGGECFLCVVDRIGVV